MPNKKFIIPINVQEVPTDNGYRRYEITSPITLKVEMIEPVGLDKLSPAEANATYTNYLHRFIRAEVLNILETPITIKELKESK